MAVFPIAYIPPQHYERIRVILDGNCPNTYDEWSQLYVEKVTKIRGSGHAIKDVQIDPEKLSGYCDTHREARNLHGLDNFAFACWKAAQDKA